MTRLPFCLQFSTSSWVCVEIHFFILFVIYRAAWSWIGYTLSVLKMSKLLSIQYLYSQILGVSQVSGYLLCCLAYFLPSLPHFSLFLLWRLSWGAKQTSYNRFFTDPPAPYSGGQAAEPHQQGRLILPNGCPSIQEEKYFLAGKETIGNDPRVHS